MVLGRSLTPSGLSSHREAGVVAAPSSQGDVRGDRNSVERSVPCLARGETLQLLLLIAVSRPPSPSSGSSPSGGSRAEGRFGGVRAKAGFTASEAGRADAPERPGLFPRRRAWAVGASESLLPVCTMMAPRIPGSSYRSCVLAVPSRCQWRVLAALAVPDSSHLSVCLSGGKALFGWATHCPGSQPTLTSYLARAAVAPQPRERCGARSNTGHAEAGEHPGRAASARRQYRGLQAVGGKGRATGQRWLTWLLTPRALEHPTSAHRQTWPPRPCLSPFLYSLWWFQFQQEARRQRIIPHELTGAPAPPPQRPSSQASGPARAGAQVGELGSEDGPWGEAWASFFHVGTQAQGQGGSPSGTASCAPSPAPPHTPALPSPVGSLTTCSF